MAIDVLIKQKLFGGKTMPLEVILGEHLQYGNFVNDQLHVGQLGDTEFIAFLPESIGRGFSVIWNPKETRKIALRLPQPSTPRELKEFFAAIERMVNYWDGKLIVDGTRLPLPGFLSAFDDFVDFNYTTIKQLAQQVLDGEDAILTLYSTMWPLAMGKEEATRFMEDPDYYAQWLHEKQSIDACFASPDFFVGERGIFGRFTLTNNVTALFPQQPAVPFGVTDPATGKPLECDEWVILLGIQGENEPLCEMAYSKFLSLIPEDKTSKYDGDHFLLSPLTEEEIKALSIQ